MLIFLSAKYIEKTIISKRIKKIISEIGAATFGLYLFEVFTPMTSILYNYIFVNSIKYTGLFLSYVYTIILWFVLGSIFIIFLRKLPLLRKIL